MTQTPNFALSMHILQMQLIGTKNILYAACSQFCSLCLFPFIQVQLIRLNWRWLRPHCFESLAPLTRNYNWATSLPHCFSSRSLTSPLSIPPWYGEGIDMHIGFYITPHPHREINKKTNWDFLLLFLIDIVPSFYLKDLNRKRSCTNVMSIIDFLDTSLWTEWTIRIRVTYLRIFHEIQNWQ